MEPYTGSCLYMSLPVTPSSSALEQSLPAECAWLQLQMEWPLRTCPGRLHLFSSTLHPVHLQHQQSSVCWATGVCIWHHPYWDHQQEGGCPSGDLVRTEQLWTQLCKDRGDGCCHAELQVEGNLLQQMKKFNMFLYRHQLVHLYLLHLHCQGQWQTTAYHFICCEDYFLVIVPGPAGLQSSVGSAEDHGGPLLT